MYTDILWPSYAVPWWSYDVNGPTNFANTQEGTLGLDIFFEVRPYGYEAVYDSSTFGTGGSEGIAAGAVVVLSKPFDLELMRTTVARQIPGTEEA